MANTEFLEYKLSKCASNAAFCEMFVVMLLIAAIIRYETNLPTRMLPVGFVIGFGARTFLFRKGNRE